jgi:hypothetical protein
MLKDKPVLTYEASCAMNVFYDLINERDYTGQYSLPCRIKKSVIENSIKMLYNNVDKKYLIDLITAVDDAHVTNIITAHNEAMKSK